MTYPVTLELRAVRNDDFGAEWTLTDGTSEANPGDPIDLTGWTADMEIRLYAGASGSALIDLATVTTDIQGVRFIEASQGRIVIRIQDTAINGLPTDTDRPDQPMIFYWDLVLTDPTSDRHNYVGGKFTVYPKVTA